jgi:hypothetical protein
MRANGLLSPLLGLIGLSILLFLRLLSAAPFSPIVYYLLVALAVVMMVWFISKGSILFTGTLCVLGVAFFSSLSVSPGIFVRDQGEEEIFVRGIFPTLGGAWLCLLALLAGGDKPTITQFRVWPVFFAGIFLVGRASAWFLEAVNVPHRWLAVSWFGIGIFLTVASVYAWHKTRRTGA